MGCLVVILLMLLHLVIGAGIGTFVGFMVELVAGKTIVLGGLAVEYWFAAAGAILALLSGGGGGEQNN